MNFDDILNTQLDEVEKPKPIPVGTYTVRISAEAPKLEAVGEKQSPKLTIEAIPLIAGEDVDTELLALVPQWNERKLRLDFFLTPDSQWRFKEFAQHCGINTDGRTLRDIIPELANAQVNVKVKHRTFKDNIFAEAESYAPVE